jgi:RHS repeat-associated protein
MPDGKQIQYLIDGQNRRVGKIVNGRIVECWLYQNQLNIVAELDSLGNVASRFVYGTKGHVPDYMVKNSATYQFITDHLGSVRFVVDVASGAVVQYISYDEFGNILTDTNPGFQPFGYAGGLYDGQTGLVRFGARDYEAYSGRWTAKDPIGFQSGDCKLYVYCNNNSVNYIDISGLIIAYIDNSTQAYFQNDIKTIYKTEIGRLLISKLETDKRIYTVHLGKAPIIKSSGADPYNPTDIYIDPCNDQEGYYDSAGEWHQASDIRKLVHELGHMANYPENGQTRAQYEKAAIMMWENQ